MCFCFNEMSQTAELYTLGHCGTESYSSVLTLKTKGSLGRWKKVETCQTRWAGFRHWFGNFSGSDHRYAPVLFSKSLITCNISSPAEMFGVQTKMPHLRCWSSGSSLLHEGLGRVRSGMIYFGIFMPIITVQVVSGMQHVWVTFIELSANLQLPHANTFGLWKCTHTKTLLRCSCWMLPQKNKDSPLLLTPLLWALSRLVCFVSSKLLLLFVNTRENEDIWNRVPDFFLSKGVLLIKEVFL